jgi:CheY-like chemotaxis protein
MFTRRMLKRILTEAGYEVIEALNGQQCLDLLEVQAPDCLILDLLMPEVTGYEVLQTLQEEAKRLPVIVMTADIQDSSRQKCLDLGAIAVLNKPPQADQFLQVLQNVLVSQGDPMI